MSTQDATGPSPLTDMEIVALQRDLALQVAFNAQQQNIIDELRTQLRHAHQQLHDQQRLHDERQSIESARAHAQRQADAERHADQLAEVTAVLEARCVEIANAHRYIEHLLDEVAKARAAHSPGTGGDAPSMTT